jgi:hypothetical protein
MAVTADGKANPDDYFTMLLKEGALNRPLTTQRYVGASAKPGSTYVLAAVRHGNPEEDVYEAAHFAVNITPKQASQHWGKPRFLPGSEGWDIPNLNGKKALPGAVRITLQPGKMHYIGNALYLLDNRKPTCKGCPLTATAQGWQWTWGNAEEASKYAGVLVEAVRVRGD